LVRDDIYLCIKSPKIKVRWVVRLNETSLEREGEKRRMRKPGERRVERQGKYIFIVNEVDKDPGESVACGASNAAARVADYATWLHLSHRPSPSRRTIQVRLPRFSIWSRTLLPPNSTTGPTLFPLWHPLCSWTSFTSTSASRFPVWSSVSVLCRYHCTISNALYTYHTPNNYHRSSEPPSVLCTIAGTIWHM
jgi:hypothetical protein